MSGFYETDFYAWANEQAALLRAGFPVYDSYSAPSETWIGYSGARRTIFRVADLLAAHYQEIAPYVSKLRQRAPDETAPC